MSEFTNGPWEIGLIYNSDEGRELTEYVTAPLGTRRVKVARVIGISQRRGHKEDKANAQLIATAPELLETLEHIKGFLERIDTETCGLDEHIELIESKIQKAKGELNG